LEEKKEDKMSGAIEQAKFFFTYDSHPENKVILESSWHPEHLKIKVHISPNKEEAKEFPPNFFIEFSDDVLVVPGHGFCKFSFDNPHFNIAGKEFDFADICPDTVLEMNTDSSRRITHGGFDPHLITMFRFDSPLDFLVLLHEMGHEADFEKRGKKYFGMGSGIYEKDPIGIGGVERNAWAEGFKIIRKLDLPIAKNLLDLAQKKLQGYQEPFGTYKEYAKHPKKSGYQAITDKERREVRESDEHILPFGGSKLKKAKRKK